MDGRELHYISQAYNQRKFSGDGPFGKSVEKSLSEKYFYNQRVLLTPSGTASLELCLLALDLNEGDEIIVPSYTFVSCANSVLIAGGKPVFADISEDDQNINYNSILELYNSKTRAIMVVHYGGFACDLTKIKQFCESKNIVLIEDAAHCIGASYQNRELGTFGTFGCFSFHETKNLHCGEGGALVVNDPKYISKIETIREKGTDRSVFLRGEIDKYTWRDKGSSYLLSEINAAFLFAQLENSEKVINRRKQIYDRYRFNLASLESDGFIKLPKHSSDVSGNGHIFHLLLNPKISRVEVLNQLKRVNIQLLSHYVALHSSPMGEKFRCGHLMPNSENAEQTLLRLPIWFELEDKQIDLISASLALILKNNSNI